MEYLTVKEVAELNNCSERYIRKLISTEKLVSEQDTDPSNGHKKHKIPISALPDELQQRYYKRQRSDAGLLPEVKEKVKPAAKKQRAFEELTADERAEVNVWTEIVKEWQGLRNGYKGSKVEFDKLYIGKCKIEHPDIKVSKDILYRKWSAYRENDMEGLIDKRGAWNKGNSKIPPQVWDYFLWCWLDENQPTTSLCYRNTIEWTEEFYPELVSMIPTERSFRRQIDRDVKYAIKVLMREGDKAFNDRCAPYAMRMYESLEANDCWIADNHTFDVISLDGETKHRLYLTAFLDAKSGVMTGWNITDAPSAQSTILALRHGIMRFGIPKCIYVDNGREFLNISFGGRGHRSRKSMEGQPEPPAILKRLGIEMRNAIVRNARAKPIERTFRTVKEQFSKLFSGFCGGTILERPESLKFRIEVLRSFSDYFNDKGQTLGICFIGNLDTVARIGSKKAEFAQIANRTKQKQVYTKEQIRRDDIIKLFPLLEVGNMDKEIDFLHRIARTPQAIRGVINLFSNAYDNEDYSFKGLVAAAKGMNIEV